MIVRALVAICDNVVGRDGFGFAENALTAQHNLPIPVLLEFDKDRVVGKATLEREGPNVFARMELLADTPIVDKFPALGIRAHRRLGPVFTHCSVLAISLNKNQNADPRVPPITAPGGPIVV